MTTTQNGTIVPVEQKPPREPPKVYTPAALRAMDLKPPEMLVEGLLPVGLALIAAPPKSGKSFLCLELAYAIASGQTFLGRKCTRGGVLYLALEDSLARIADRCRIIANERPDDAIMFMTEAGTIEDGLFPNLEFAMMSATMPVKLIICDTMAYVAGERKSLKESSYAADYRQMKALKCFADAHGICILLVHHTTKMSIPSDPFAMISGTFGIFGALDTAWVILREERNSTIATMCVTGRDIDQAEIAIEKRGATWAYLGPVEGAAKQTAVEMFRQKPIVRLIDKMLAENLGSWSGTAADIVEAARMHGIELGETGKSASAVGRCLKNLGEEFYQYDGVLIETKRGKDARRVEISRVFK